VNRISLAAGLAKGTVYNHFASKRELFLAVVAEASGRAAEGASSVPDTAPTAKRLVAILESDVRWAAAEEAFARVLVREALGGDLRVQLEIVEAAAPFLQRVVEILADGVERGEVRGDLPAERLALLFTGLGDLALSFHWASDRTWPPLEEIPELVTDVFLNGAGA
jgi:AcrR family transcriptional regulator